jgi:hypothetical protein
MRSSMTSSRGGAEGFGLANTRRGTRTPDSLRVKEMLYQLSYPRFLAGRALR